MAGYTRVSYIVGSKTEQVSGVRPHLLDTVICSDSQATLRAMSSSWITSKIVRMSRRHLNSIFRFGAVEIFWVPGHCDVEGDETLDALGKNRSIWGVSTSDWEGNGRC